MTNFRLFIIAVLCLVCFPCLNVKAQPSDEDNELLVDSLRLIVNNSQVPDSDRIRTSDRLVKLFWDRNQDSVRLYANKMLLLSKKSGDVEGTEVAYNRLVRYYWRIGKIDTAQMYLEQVYVDQKQRDDRKSMAKSVGNLGLLEYMKGNYPEALDFYFESLKLKKEVGDSSGAAKTLGNIGLVYYVQKDYDEALKYYQDCLDINERLGDEYSIGLWQGNIGLIYAELHQYDTAKYFYLSSLKSGKEINDLHNISVNYDRLGIVYMELEQYDSAEVYYTMALELSDSLQDLQNVGLVYGNMGALYYRQGKLDVAEKCLLKSIEYSQNTNSREQIMEMEKTLAEVYEKQNNYQLAYRHFRLHSELKDSLFNDEKSAEIGKLEARYEFDKQKAIDDARHEKELAVEKEKQKQQQTRLYAAIGGLFIIVISALIIYRRLQITRKQKKVIEEQRSALEEANVDLIQSNEEILAQRDQIESQKNVIEQKHHEIHQSITYARRIQNAILPPKSLLNKWLPSHFTYYNPKDVVAGDFYWLEAVEEQSMVYFAVADCTGHGVPGAMVSVVCHGALNRSIREYKLTEPAEILTKTSELVLKTFEKSEEQVKDGMDLALCAYNTQTGKLQFSGANNSLYIIRNGEMEEVKGTKQPIGFVDDLLPFKQYETDANDISSIYLSSDGFPDQFGGPKGRKFGYRRLRELFVEISGKSMEEQHEIIAANFENWLQQGTDDQIDDVCVMGIQFKG